MRGHNRYLTERFCYYPSRGTDQHVRDCIIRVVACFVSALLRVSFIPCYVTSITWLIAIALALAMVTFVRRHMIECLYVANLVVPVSMPNVVRITGLNVLSTIDREWCCM